MILQDIDVGTIADDGTGDELREGAIKINANNALIADVLSGAVAGDALAGTEKLLGLDGTANKAWLISQIGTYITALLVDSAPATLDTLNELAAALGDDPDYAATTAIALAAKRLKPGLRSESPATGATITMADSTTDDVRLYLYHAATIATLTIMFPPTPFDGQIFALRTLSAVTALTLSASHPILAGASSLVANNRLSWEYSASADSWMRAG